MIDRRLLEEDFEPYRIRRFVFDQPEPDGPATATFTLDDGVRIRVLEFAIAEPRRAIENLEPILPPYLMVTDTSGRGWESPAVQVEHPHGGGVYFYASGLRELLPPAV